MPFLAKNLLFLNSQTQCAEKFLFRCSCRVKQGCRLANPERTAERKFHKHWAHVFESVMSKVVTGVCRPGSYGNLFIGFNQETVINLYLVILDNNLVNAVADN